MNKQGKKDKGGEEAGSKKQKSAEQLGKELLRAAEKCDAERVRELLQCEGVDVRYHERTDAWGPRTALVVACKRGGCAPSARAWWGDKA
jgi:hypothetical protein